MDDAIRSAQSFIAGLDSRYESDRASIVAKTQQAKDKLASGLLDLKESAVPQAPPPPVAPVAPMTTQQAYDRYSEVSGNGAASQTFTEDSFDVGLPAFDHDAAPEPALDMNIGDDDVMLDDDGIPTWQEP